MHKVAILASGTGTNALALNEAYQAYYHQNALIITDNAHSPIANDWMYIASTSKSDFEAKLLSRLYEYKCDWLLLAGFMKVLSPNFLNEFHSWHGNKNQIINIHPSMLPQLKGLNAYQKAWEQDYEKTGISIHYVTKELDSGEMILQKELLVDKSISFSEWVVNNKKTENEMYKKVLNEILTFQISTKKFQRTLA